MSHRLDATMSKLLLSLLDAELKRLEDQESSARKRKMNAVADRARNQWGRVSALKWEVLHKCDFL